MTARQVQGCKAMACASGVALTRQASTQRHDRQVCPAASPWCPGPRWGSRCPLGAVNLLNGLWHVLGIKIDWSLAVHAYGDPTASNWKLTQPYQARSQAPAVHCLWPASCMHPRLAAAGSTPAMHARMDWPCDACTHSTTDVEVLVLQKPELAGSWPALITVTPCTSQTPDSLSAPCRRTPLRTCPS